MRIMIIDPEQASLQDMTTHLQGLDDVTIVETNTKIFADFNDLFDKQIDILFVDYDLSDQHNMNFVVQLVLRCPTIQIVLLKSQKRFVKGSNISEIQFLSKPIQPIELDRVMENIHYQRRKVLEQVPEPNPYIGERHQLS